MSLVLKSVRPPRRRWWDNGMNILFLVVLTYGLVLVAMSTEGPIFNAVQAYRGMIFIVLATMLSVLNALWSIRRAITRDRIIEGDISAHISTVTAPDPVEDKS